ncbi:M23 family metallopeptidase [Actinomyces ruminicola]|uniref:Murein DD-endopeptidase MepM and murein hydrolase activator NlpD, contain LysM domain n=1 Tax=Actinomyces ruminicola TaxID=332524 RepID=A0A1G9TUH2_9ACTO|nr:M23 family metallopeptidase [Actinomyces ruminicola]SDM50885.1 Murein DD-endopeptidase MepM and murein hydrolase activator NlpD, contain LysM domain [Actinomyces ruminicola]
MSNLTAAHTADGTTAAAVSTDSAPSEGRPPGRGSTGPAPSDRSPGGIFPGARSPARPRRRPPGLRRPARRLTAAGAALATGAALVLSPAPALAGATAALPSAQIASRQTMSAWRGGDPSPLQALAAGPASGRAAALPGALAARVRYAWPTGMATTVLADFDPPAVVWGAGHRGVDLALAAGSQVLAAADGTVAFAGMVAGRPVVSIDHADGIRTTYEPVDPCVRAGDVVARGQVIGTLQAGHRADGADALHWGARTGPKAYVNPLRLLEPAVIRLKPLV